MSMKYIKLFESWKLMEAGKQDAFDKNNPDGFPVANTTIGDLRKAYKSGKGEDVLFSILRRALQTGKQWDPEAGKDKSVLSEVRLYSMKPRGFFGPKKNQTGVQTAMNKLGLDHRDGASGEKLFDALTAYIRPKSDGKNFDYKTYFSDSASSKEIFEEGMTEKKFDNVLKDFSNHIRDLKKMSEDKRALKLNTRSKNAIPVLEQMYKDVEERFAKAKDAKPIRTITLNGPDDKWSIDLKADIEDSSLNPDDAPVTDFIISNFEGGYVGEDAMDPSIDENTLTLGMVMTWMNNYAKTGSSKLSLLSNTGAKNYQGNIASIFAGEEAESLTEFAVTLKIGGQSIDLSNDASGNAVPFFAGDEMFGVCKFDFDSAKLQDSGKDTLKLDKLWKKLATAKNTLEIVGHTDSTGKADYNQKLSEARANAVLKFMQSLPQAKGLKVKMTASGKGSTKPAKDDKGGKDKKMAALNRRVEILIDGVGFDYTKL